MALKFVVDTLDGLPPAVRDHYTAKDGKFVLALDGDHPDTARVAEFRQTNIRLTKELARFDGLDPDVAKADKAKLAELETARPNERITELEAKLATMQASANASILNEAVKSAFLKIGGRGDAAAYIASKAADKLEVVNGAIVGKVFDPDKPGERLTVESFVTSQLRESPFAFHASQGGGANPAPGGGAPSRGNELRNPTPQQLGEHAAAIRAGRVKVVYDT